MTGPWMDPPWDSPLDAVAEIRRIPADATMTGLFLAAVADACKLQGVALSQAQPRYVAFKRYPLREHCELLVEAAGKLWPGLPLRQGLRKLGRGAPKALVVSMLGRVVLGSVDGPLEVLQAMAKSYPMHTHPGSIEVQVLGPGRVIIKASNIHHFLDSHHVGVFEGVMLHAGVRGSVKVCPFSRTSADLLCVWEGQGA